MAEVISRDGIILSGMSPTTWKVHFGLMSIEELYELINICVDDIIRNTFINPRDMRVETRGRHRNSQRKQLLSRHYHEDEKKKEVIMSPVLQQSIRERLAVLMGPPKPVDFVPPPEVNPEKLGPSDYITMKDFFLKRAIDMNVPEQMETWSTICLDHPEYFYRKNNGIKTPYHLRKAYLGDFLIAYAQRLEFLEQKRRMHLSDTSHQTNRGNWPITTGKIAPYFDPRGPRSPRLSDE